MIARPNESIIICIVLGAVTLTIIFAGLSSRPSSSNDDVTSVISKHVYYKGYKVDSQPAGEYRANYPKLTGHVFNDFDIDSKVCGNHKCFFLSKTYGKFGYLVTTRDLLPNSEKTYELAKKLEKNDLVIQPLLTPPELVPLSQEMAEKLGERNDKNQLFETGEIVVNRSRAIKDAVVMGCHMENGKDSEELKKILPQWIKEAEDPDQFRRNFQVSLHATKMALQENPCLFRDMHVMVDKHGSVYHIDLDRCYHTDELPPAEEMIKCINSLIYLKKKVAGLAVVENIEREKLLKK